MCVSECVCLHVCFGGLQGRGRGSGKGTELSLLCCFVFSCVARRKSTTKRGEPKLFVCPPPSVVFSTPPLFPHLLIGPCWMSRNGLEGEESHTDRRTTVWRCLSNREGKKSGRKKDEVRTTWVSPSPCLPSLPFPLLWQRVTIQPKPVTKMSSVCFGEKKSVSEQQLDCLALQCVFVCVQGCRLHIIKNGDRKTEA